MNATDPGGTGPRRPTAVDAIAEAHLDRLCALDPLFATEIGRGGHDDRLTDFSAQGCAERAEVAAGTLSALGGADVVDAIDRVTVATMSASLRRELALADAGEHIGNCNVIASPLQALRDVFDLMPTDTREQRETFLSRLTAIPASLTDVVDGLAHRLRHGPPPARRQVAAVARQADTAADAIAGNTAPIAADPALAGTLATALDAARTSFGTFAHYLRTGVLAQAVDDDAVGRDRYLLHLPAYLGADADPDDAYAWAMTRLQQIVAEQQEIAEGLLPGQGVAATLAWLDRQPQYQIHDRAEFVDWMQATSDAAVAGLAGTHFDLPARLSRLECRLAPSSTGIIYYTQPSEDLSRPGRMWWAVPDDQTVFHTWQEKTTVYHEGVPGHHLQLGSAIVDPDLNAWRKLASFTSGHGEGWALYAERLMDELGWLEDPGDRMGMLDSQRLRAARVVVDIGVHCRLPAPESLGGGMWDADKAWTFLTSSVAMDHAVLRFELDRYLGWPGQAPSYALGQRVWEQTRTAALRRHPDWTLKDFHSRALALGGVSLDVLAAEVAGEDQETRR
ncbi:MULTISPECIES: DUF885 domain-containing protein [unclassified Gordonia (in: high G+C Gram-positive bacteria)]|uniref:DUF885 domain-containing protein n=1 Tax=unclassified Gordonia (in: high G+C Gram-positive bacteria) TaxID=2657482 RepID=UPI0010F8F5BD|nr:MULTISPECIES: DUF885 domain-containing protein [unclassified Gordonia (in: high G+C Gram-positive bacteria)]